MGKEEEIELPDIEKADSADMFGTPKDMAEAEEDVNPIVFEAVSKALQIEKAKYYALIQDKMKKDMTGVGSSIFKEKLWRDMLTFAKGNQAAFKNLSEYKGDLQNVY